MEIMEMIAEKHSPAITDEWISEELYEKAFPPVARFVHRMKGSLEDAKDIFHDALVIFYEKNTDQHFSITTSEEAYILGIAKHLWIRKFNQSWRNVSLDEAELEISIPHDYNSAFDDNRLMLLLERAGKKCLDLLKAFYYDKLSMRTIAPGLGYRNEHSATVQKYKCLEKVRDTVKEKSIKYEDFIE